MSSTRSLAPIKGTQSDTLDSSLIVPQRPSKTGISPRPAQNRRSGYQNWFGFPPAQDTQRLGSGPFVPVSKLTRRRTIRTWSQPALTEPVVYAQPEAQLPSLPPFPQLPAGIELESEDSLRALATMVVAYHDTVPPGLQAEFVRLLMKYAGETAGSLIRQHMYP